jgi:REP element-mobilizing transposase RayT
MLKRWTKEEIELLRENYKKPKEELLRLFPNRSWISIDHKIFRLGFFLATTGQVTLDQLKKYVEGQGK